MPLKRRGITVLVIAGLSTLGLVVAFFIIDSGLRAYAENRVRQEITGNFPDTVTGDVAVSIGGVSVIEQYLAGSFDRVDLEAADLDVDGVPVSVHVVATDVPVDTEKPIGAVHAAVDFEQDSLNALLRAGGHAGDAELQLGDGEVSYAGTATLLGLPIGYLATATPEADEDWLVLTPTSAEVTTEAGAIDLTGIVPLILGREPITVCVAQFLPDGVDLTSVNVTPDRARITLESSTLMLSKQSLTNLGSCSAR